jgi:hypothetical protein
LFKGLPREATAVSSSPYTFLKNNASQRGNIAGGGRGRGEDVVKPRKLRENRGIENSNNPLTNYTVSKFLDHGTANPIVARLTLQTFAILDACNLSKEAADEIKVVYMHTLTKTLVRCGEIAMRYQSEFVKEMEAYKRRPPSAIVTVPSITSLEAECRNFLYEAKNFIRDTLKAFNLL